MLRACELNESVENTWYQKRGILQIAQINNSTQMVVEVFHIGCVAHKLQISSKLLAPISYST